MKRFVTPELMRWPLIASQFGNELLSTDIFATPGIDADSKAVTRWEDFRKRVIEHNVRVVAKFYTRIRMDRLQTLLDLGEEEAESYLSKLVTQKTVYARIDRPSRIVDFKEPRDSNEVLNEWSGNMKGLLGLLERVDHLITKVLYHRLSSLILVSLPTSFLPVFLNISWKRKEKEIC